MRIAFLKFGLYCHFAVLTGCMLLLGTMPVMAKPAMMMPNVEQSLLTDLASIGSKVVAVGERGHILVSDNSGESWLQSAVPIDQLLTAVDFIDEQTGWAVAFDGHVVATVDGGKTWVLQRDGLKAQSEANIQKLYEAKANVERLQQYVKDVESGAIVVKEIPPEEYELDEYGYDIVPLTPQEQLEEANWLIESAQDSLNSTVVTSPLMDVWFADHQHGWAVGAFGLIIETKDGGKTWLSRDNDIGNDEKLHLNAVIGSSGGAIYVAGEAGFLSYSSNNGVSWQVVDLGYGGSIFDLIAKADGSIVLAVGLRGNSFRSLDEGASWQAMNAGVDYSLASGSLYDEDHIALVGTGGTVVISEDSGSSFKQYTLPSRSSISGVVSLMNGTLLLVGQGGIHRFDPASFANKK